MIYNDLHFYLYLPIAFYILLHVYLYKQLKLNIMKTIQPKFEYVKTMFYNFVINDDKTNVLMLLERIGNTKAPIYRKRKDVFKKELNTWLDLLDIRSVNKLIDIMNENNISLPEWLKYKMFVIDYNNSNTLDLIKLNNNL